MHGTGLLCGLLTVAPQKSELAKQNSEASACKHPGLFSNRNSKTNGYAILDFNLLADCVSQSR